MTSETEEYVTRETEEYVTSETEECVTSETEECVTSETEEYFSSVENNDQPFFQQNICHFFHKLLIYVQITLFHRYI